MRDGRHIQNPQAPAESLVTAGLSPCGAGLVLPASRRETHYPDLRGNKPVKNGERAAQVSPGNIIPHVDLTTSTNTGSAKAGAPEHHRLEGFAPTALL